MTGPRVLDDVLEENGRLRNRIADLTSDSCPEPPELLSKGEDLNSGEPTCTLKASDPLAIGLLEIRTALRGHDFRYALKYFEALVTAAASLPIAPAGELMGARELAGDMEVWRFNKNPAARAGGGCVHEVVTVLGEDFCRLCYEPQPRRTPVQVVLGDEGAANIEPEA